MCTYVCEYVSVHMSVHVCLCVCMCVSERERERIFVLVIVVRFYLFLCISTVGSTRVTGTYGDIISNKLTPFIKKNRAEKQKRKTGIKSQAFLRLPGFLLQPMRDGLLLPSGRCFRSRSNPMKCTPH